MEAIRLHLRQNSANYRREETVGYRMTYPLPPYSTVIGALHNTCGYNSYHPMKVSVQGKFGSIVRRMFKENCFLNGNSEISRGTLVKMVNPYILSPAYTIVHEPITTKSKNKSKNNSVDEDIGIKNKKLFEEYEMTKSSEFRLVVKGPKWYELLCDIELIIHIVADEDTLSDIESNICNLTAIGRREDFVEILDCKRVKLTEENEGFDSDYKVYIPLEIIEKNTDKFYLFGSSEAHYGKGTKYLITKEYETELLKGGCRKRIFNKVPVLYCGNFGIEGNCDGVLFDKDGEENYAVFLA